MFNVMTVNGVDPAAGGRGAEVQRHLRQGEQRGQHAGHGRAEARAGEQEEHDRGEPGGEHQRRAGDVGDEPRGGDVDLAQHEAGGHGQHGDDPGTRRAASGSP